MLFVLWLFAVKDKEEFCTPKTDIETDLTLEIYVFIHISHEFVVISKISTIDILLISFVVIWDYVSFSFVRVFVCVCLRCSTNEPPKQLHEKRWWIKLDTIYKCFFFMNFELANQSGKYLRWLNMSLLTFLIFVICVVFWHFQLQRFDVEQYNE